MNTTDVLELATRQLFTAR